MYAFRQINKQMNNKHVCVAGTNFGSICIMSRKTRLACHCAPIANLEPAWLPSSGRTEEQWLHDLWHRLISRGSTIFLMVLTLLQPHRRNLSCIRWPDNLIRLYSWIWSHYLQITEWRHFENPKFYQNCGTGWKPWAAPRGCIQMCADVCFPEDK